MKSSARCRCVSKQWCNYINDSYLETMHAKRAHPMLITFHRFSSFSHPNSPCKLSFLEYKEDALEMKKKPPAMVFMCRTRNFDYPYYHAYVIVQGSCNGLLYSSQRHDDVITLVVINPLRRECYEVPPMNTPFCAEPSWHPVIDRILCVEPSCGLGFDDSTNTFKMVCVVPRKQVQPKFNPVKDEHLCTMVHVLGTHSWRKIPQVPSYPITSEGVFANGCLHWLANCKHDKFPIIRFDMKTEKFRLIKSPRKRTTDLIRVHLVDLHGQVGFVYMVIDCIVEVWVLKERQWAL
ncbi:putative F-box associated interaction domain, F-box-like domain superfamily [Helianthus annuus]|nr:putative F-box associated interaction domain, F-box-like domain superfamily [Helianthus annuus]